MLFNSFDFIVFSLIVLLLYYTFQEKSLQKTILIAASAFFIFYAGILSFVIISLVTILNYFIGIKTSHKREFNSSSFIFTFGILVNIANLFFFKYYNFFITNINFLDEILGFNIALPFVDVILPLGISFYTFSLLAYLIDVKLGNILVERNFISFANYVFFFPKLLAGPIERAQQFLSQTQQRKGIYAANFTEGTKLIIWGFFQKLVVADRIAIYVNSVDPNLHTGITILVSSILYTFQVYADFSGYTDIARGLACILGYSLMENFRQPLLATSVTDFWRRWHISLSSWVNDYIHTPLSLLFRNFGLKGTIGALFISFVIIGIWHGATWTFVLFGLFQGIFITLELLSLNRRMILFKIFPKWVVQIFGTLITFSFITLSLVLFRATSIDQAVAVFRKIFTPVGSLYHGTIAYIVYALLGIIVIITRDVLVEYKHRDPFIIPSRFFAIRSMFYSLLIILILLIGVFDGGQFIYFKF
jgi:alginate O-acetyltransferase complex protein AlgI